VKQSWTLTYHGGVSGEIVGRVGITSHSARLYDWPTRSSRKGPSVVTDADGTLYIQKESNKYDRFSLDNGAKISFESKVKCTLDLDNSEFTIEIDGEQVYRITSFEDQPLSKFTWYPFIGLYKNNQRVTADVEYTLPSPSRDAMKRLYERLVGGNEPVTAKFVRAFSSVLQKACADMEEDTEEANEEQSILTSCCTTLSKMVHKDADKVNWRRDDVVKCVPETLTSEAEIICISLLDAITADDDFMNGLRDETILAMEEATPFTQSMAAFYQRVLSDADGAVISAAKVQAAARQLRKLSRALSDAAERETLLALTKTLEQMAKRKAEFKRVDWAACIPSVGPEVEGPMVKLIDELLNDVEWVRMARSEM